MKLATKLMTLAGLVALSTSACSTVTITEKGIAKLDSHPTYEDSRPFYLWGLVGEERVDVKTICQGRSAKQVQAQDTFLDSFLGIITIGIYRPRTAKVWCNS